MQVPTMADMDEWTDTLRQEFDDFEKYWHQYNNLLRDTNEKIVKVNEDRLRAEGKSRNGADVLGIVFGLEYDKMYKSWKPLKEHLDSFNFEREKQTARIVSALSEIETLKDELKSEQATLREEQEQMRKEQAILREYFDTLKNQNEALMQTRSAPATSESSTLNEIKDLIKSMKDD